jgi:CubicO group peptidase (beta-lactamase class C family)
MGLALAVSPVDEEVILMSRMIRSALLAAAFLSAGTLRAQAQTDAWTAAVATFDAYARADSTVGAALVLVEDGRIVKEHYVGMADRERGIRANRGTIWHWGSITKTMTATGAMQLAQRGRLDLDAPVTNHVPEIRRIHNPFGSMDSITLRMLMSHSSGLQSGTWPWSRGRSWEPFEPTEWSQLVGMMPYMEIAFEPGSRYNYSNPGILYIARAMEIVSGDPWQGYIYKNIFAPLGIHDSYFGATPWHLLDRRSHNYHVVRRDGSLVVEDRGIDFDPGATIPNGGWNAPISDLAVWAGFLTGSSDPATQARYDVVLPRKVLQSMWMPVVRVDEMEEMGLSFFLRRVGDRLVIGHTGTQAGFRSFIYASPENRRAVIGVVNTSTTIDGNRSNAEYRRVMSAAIAALH